MIEVKRPSVRALRWTNDSPRCLLEGHDNSILLAGEEREQERQGRGGNSDLAALFEAELN